MLVDWYARGAQVVTVRRGCIENIAAHPCSTEDYGYMFVKDCYDNCAEHGCNIGLDVAKKFDEGVGQKECFACDYQEYDNGDVSGNKNCMDQPENSMNQTCPIWASSGCYTGTAKSFKIFGDFCIFLEILRIVILNSGTAVHNIGGTNGRREEVHKGCSSFYIGEDTHYHNETIADTAYNFAKQTCQGQC